MSSNTLNTSVDITSCTSSDFVFMRLIRQGNNPNKETLMYIPYALYHHRLSVYNLSCIRINYCVTEIICKWWAG